MAAAVTATALAGTGVSPAAAGVVSPPTCGTGGTPNVVALADPSFYIDTSAGLAATYAGYTVRSADAADGLWLGLGGFTGGSVGLAPGQPGSVALPDIAAGSSATAYLLLAASAATATPQTHTVTVYRGAPGAGDAVCQRSFTYRGVFETIKALANKVTSVTTSAPAGAAHIGDEMAVTVTGHTGTLGAGPAVDPGVLSYAPNAVTSFPAAAWRLEKTTMTISPDGAAPAVTYTDHLYLPAASGPDRPYTAQYLFRAIGPASGGAAVAPVQYIASGTQVKHTDIGGGVQGALPSVSPQANVTLAKAASAGIVPATGGTVTYTVTAANSGATAGTIDDIVDTLPPGAAYQTGSSVLGGRAVADPAVSGSTLVWSGPIVAPAGGSIDLRYDVHLPGTPGPKVNSAVADFGTAQFDTSRDVTQSDPATATVTVLDAGGSARAVDDAATTAANTAVVVHVLANDSSTGGFPLAVPAVGSPAHGTAAAGSDGTVTYTPAAGFAGVDTFTYTLSDGYSTATGTVTVTVSPLARNDVYSTDKGTTLSGTTVLANDACTGCTVSLVTGPATGTLTLHADGTFTYVAPNQAGTATFTYRATAPGGTSTTAVATIYVNAAGPDQATTAYHTTVTIAVTANDACPGGTNCNVTADTTHAPAHGTVTYDAGNNAVYSPAGGFWGVDTFQYKLNGGAGATVTVLVAPPAATLQTTFGHPVSGNAATAAFSGVTTIACSGCTYSMASSPAHGTVALDSTTGALTYTPAASFAGTDTFTYAVTDPATGLTATAGAVTVTVGPDAADDSATTLAGHDVVIPVLANDACPGTCTVTVTGAPSTGTATVDPDGTVTFSDGPAHDIGVVTFQYSTASSLAPGLTDVATVTVTVEGAVDDTATTTPGLAVPVDVQQNDPCTGCTLGPIGTPSAGTATAGTGGTVLYTPPAGFSGTATFTYTVTKNGRSTGATVTVTVLPAAVDDSYAVRAGTSADLDPRANDLCVACTITGVTVPDGGGSATVAGDGQSVHYTPGVAAGAEEHFSYTVQDLAGHAASAVVTVRVDAPPGASDDTATTTAGSPAVVDVLANDGCPGCSADVAGDPAHGSVAFRADGRAQYLPDPGFSGRDAFRYVVTDPVTGLSAEATVTVTVLPVAVDDRAATGQGVATTVAVLANDSCTGCSVTVVPAPGHGTASVNPDGTVGYSPDGGFAGTDSFGYRITDPATGGQATASVTVVVSNATDDAATTAYGAPVDIAVLANDTFCAGCAVQAVGTPGHGSASLLAGGAVRYQPDAGFWGLDTFTYQAGTGTTSADATVRILVAPPDRHATAGIGGTAAGDLLGTAPCAGCTFTAVGGPLGDLALTDGGAWTYRAPGTALDDTVTYQVTDPVSGLAVTGRLVISVRPSAVTVAVSVLNDNGGTLGPADFPLTLNGAPVTAGQSNTVASGVQYTVAETVPAGYAETGVACADDDTGQSVGHPFTLAGGQLVTCTVTDDDVAPAPALALTKTAGPIVDANGSGRVDAGDTVTYGYVVANTGNVALAGVTVTDDRIDPSTAVACDPGGGAVIASLAPGASETCSATYTLRQGDVDAGTLTATGTAATDPSGPTPVSAGDAVHLTVPRQNGLTVALSLTGRDDADGSGTDSTGDRLRYSAVARNTGTTTLTGVTLSDPRSGDGLACGTLAPGGTCTLPTAVVLTQADVDAATVANTVTASGTGPDAAPVAASDSDTARLVAGPAGLSITTTLAGETDVDHSGDRTAGDVLTYDVRATNTGGQTVTGVTVVDDTTGARTACAVLAPGATCSLGTDHTVTAAEGLAGTVTNNAHAEGDGVSTVTAVLTLPAVQHPAVGHTVSGIIWFDVNRDGRREPGEPVLPGAAVSLEPAAQANSVRAAGSAGRPAAGAPVTVTGADGRYEFTGVAPGSYDVVAHAAAGGLPTTWDSDGATDWRVALSVTTADAVADFASTGSGSVAGTVVDRATGAAIPGAAIDCTWAGLDGVPGTADDVTFAATSGADGGFVVAGAPFGHLACAATDGRTGETQTFAADLTATEPARAQVLLGQPAGSRTGGVLPFTGTDARRYGYLGLTLVAAGLALRRRSASS